MQENHHALYNYIYIYIVIKGCVFFLYRLKINQKRELSLGLLAQKQTLRFKHRRAVAQDLHEILPGSQGKA
jgi:hypothetical protein